jgi:zinc transport system permease protein
MFPMDDFVGRALLAGLAVAVVAGPLGCFVVWRRMAYFGDALAHSAFLGVTLGFLLGIDLTLGVIVVAAVVALLLAVLQDRRKLAADTVLGLLSHGALAFGLLALAFVETLRVDLIGYLFGDILAVTVSDLVWIVIGGAVVLAALARLWTPLLAMTVDEDLARASGMPVPALRLTFMLLVALVVALGMKVVGVLLITALLIMPAAAARRLARSPETMAVFAALIGALAVGGGLAASLAWDLPAGPAVVATAVLLFAVTNAVPSARA